MTDSISCRRATADDRDAIWQVRTASISGLCRSHYRDEEIEAWAGAPIPHDFAEVIYGREFVVAECHGAIVGFGFLDRQSRVIEALFVEPRYARRGVGRRILASLESAARRAGVRCLTLSSSLNAVSFYDAAGYRVLRETTWHHPAGFSLRCMAMGKEL